MSAMVNVNGRISDQEHAVISVFDHGFLYGEGVYETLRTYSGQPFLFDRHMRRLRTSASMLALSVPPTNEDIDRRLRRHCQEPSGVGEPADQIEQSPEQCVGDAGGVQARRLRRCNAELSRR